MRSMVDVPLWQTSFVSRKHEGDKVIVFTKAGLLWVFNFHPTKSFDGYRVGAPRHGRCAVLDGTTRPA